MAARAASVCASAFASRACSSTPPLIGRISIPVRDVGAGQAMKLAVNLVSFGFKHGLPMDADLVFDVRFLPNPHFVQRLRRPMH